jgi:inner membrane protein
LDSITQAALGAAIGEATLGKKIGNRAILWGALLGTIPDLDVIFSPLQDTAQRIAFHRGASHSIVCMVIASLALAKPLSNLWKTEKVTPTRAGVFVFLTWLTHVLIDCFTTYGTSVLWPLSNDRIAFNNLFIIDPLYTLPLIVSLTWLAFYRSKKQETKRARILKWGLGISSTYVLLSFAMKFYASSSFDADLARREIEYNRRIESTTAFNILLWRSVVDRDKELWVGYRSVFDLPSKPIRWTVYPKQKEIVAPFMNEREIKTLDWFSNGWWIARPHANGIWIADLRFGETRTYDDKPGIVDLRIVFSWSFEPKREGDRLSYTRPLNQNAKDSLKRIGYRILGNANQWEANPRLAGVTGSLPEWLRVVE